MKFAIMTLIPTVLLVGLPSLSTARDQDKVRWISSLRQPKA